MKVVVGNVARTLPVFAMEAYWRRRNFCIGSLLIILGEFSRDSTIKDAADNTGTSPQAVRLVYTTIRERMAETIVTHDRIGGPGTIVEIDEAQFGKRKYNRGRLVEGSWVLGGIQRDTKKCFLAVCPDNKRSERALLPIIQQYVAPGTTIITDKWKAYINLI